MQHKGKMRVQKNLVIIGGNCASLQSGRFTMRKFRGLLMRRQSVDS
jgi:hypothetical protein